MPTGLRTADYDFDLPPDLIAQSPLPQRDASRLMVIDRTSGTISHRHFSDLPALTSPGDLLVVNRSRVVKARLLGTRVGSGAPAEVFLLTPLGDGQYEAMVSPGGKLKPGRVVENEGRDSSRFAQLAITESLSRQPTSGMRNSTQKRAQPQAMSGASIVAPIKLSIFVATKAAITTQRIPIGI